MSLPDFRSSIRRLAIVRRRSRHKTAELVARYVRAAEQWTDSGLKNIGF
jgi:hypothetical protein